MSKRQRFEIVAAKRVDKIVEGLRLLGNCANKNNYEYTKEDVDLMFDEVKKALKDTQIKFETLLNKSGTKKFKFK